MGGFAVGVSVGGKDATPWYSIGAAGAGILVGGLVTFVQSSPFEDLAAQGRQGSGALATEEAWARAAQGERASRRVGAVLGLIGSAGMLAVGTVALSSSDTALRSFGVLVPVGAAFGLLSAYVLVTDGPVESGLRAYEESTGRLLRPKDAMLGHLNLAFVPGGAMGGFATNF